MALETGVTYIEDMVAANPDKAIDNVDEGADHLNLIKTAVKGSFPSLGAAAVTGTAADLNAFIPIGGIVMFTGTLTSLPANWAFCDGTGGTVDLTGQFILGASSQIDLGDSGGSADAVVVSHFHTADGTLTAASNGLHTHTVRGIENSVATKNSLSATGNSASGAVLDVAGAALADGAHTHDITGNTSTTGVSGTNANLPPYYKLAYIQRIT